MAEFSERFLSLEFHDGSAESRMGENRLSVKSTPDRRVDRAASTGEVADVLKRRLQRFVDALSPRQLQEGGWERLPWVWDELSFSEDIYTDNFGILIQVLDRILADSEDPKLSGVDCEELRDAIIRTIFHTAARRGIAMRALHAASNPHLSMDGTMPEEVEFFAYERLTEDAEDDYKAATGDGPLEGNDDWDADDWLDQDDVDALLDGKGDDDTGDDDFDGFPDGDDDDDIDG